MSAPRFQRTPQKKFPPGTIGSTRNKKQIILEGGTTKQQVQIALDLKIEQTEVQGKRKSRYSVLRKQNKSYREEFLFLILDKMYFRRKSYCFQVIKQFYLFPDQTISSDPSVGTYDRIFFHDENIHTMVKITETKLLETKLWAFLNLKMLRLKKKLQKFTTRCEIIRKKTITQLKSDSFFLIHQYSLNIRPQQQNTYQKYANVTSERKQIRILHEVPKYTAPEVKTIDKTAKIVSPQPIRVVQKSPIANTIRRVESPKNKNYRVIYPNSRQKQIKTEVKKEVIREYSPSTVYKTEYKPYQQSPQTIVTHNVCPSCSNNKEIVSSKQKCAHYVETVQGNCNLNVYNNCTFNDGIKEKEIRNSELDKNVKEKQSKEQDKKTEGRESQCSCHNCGCSQKNSRVNCCFEDGYCIEERLEYLRKLQILSERTQKKM